MIEGDPDHRRSGRQTILQYDDLDRYHVLQYSRGQLRSYNLRHRTRLEDLHLGLVTEFRPPLVEKLSAVGSGSPLNDNLKYFPYRYPRRSEDDLDLR